jgi:hypothetical protein
MTKDEALRIALDALEDHGHAWPQIHHQSRYAQAITTIKAALKAKDEPVKVRESRESHGHLWIDALYKPQEDK